MIIVNGYGCRNISEQKRIIIKSSLYSHNYAEGCNEWQAPSPWSKRLGNTAPKKYQSGGEPLSVSDLTGPGIEPKTYRTINDVFCFHDSANGLVQQKDKF